MGTQWPSKDEALLRELYPWAEPEELYGKLSRYSHPAIAHKAHKLGLRRHRRVSLDKKRRGILYISHSTGEKFNATFSQGYVLLSGAVSRSQTRGHGVLAHRYEMEHKLNRPLTKYEEVHHLDGNRANNHPDNLVLTERKEHKRFNTKRALAAKEFLTGRGLWEEFLEFEKSFALPLPPWQCE